MNQCTQNSTELLVSSVISTILTNVNTAIRFFQKDKCLEMRLSLEETIFQHIPFAALVEKQSPEGELLFKKLKQMHNDVIDRVKVVPIELPLNEKFVAAMEELLNEGKL